MPRWLISLVVILVALSWIPLALALRARTVKKPEPRIHIIQDMDNQPKVKAQSRNMLFADRRGMRPPVEGAVARGTVIGEPDIQKGATADGEWIEAIPVDVTAAMVERGRQRYDIFCSPCHGLSGYGDGMVSQRADQLQEGTWTPPTSFHTDLVRSRQPGHLFNTITNGIRNMPAYGPQIPVEDRWAIVAYVRALQRSQNATIDDVPADLQAQLR
ncbi:MAG: cytochrome c [Thermoanaerobaculales bacterium]|jgi:mono/diheme cytochrome c family protein|nr:cytochrome c [Thermoanaerobaculales bacterium]